MIKLAFMVDTGYVLGSSSEEANRQRMKLFPGALAGQLNKIQDGSHYAAGRRSASFYKDREFRPGTRQYVISRNSSLVLDDASGIEVINDYMELVLKYKDSKETLVVVGGKAIFMLFLPYASAINVAMADKSIPGDIIFREWKTFNLNLRRIEEWEGGITYYYTKRPAQIY